MEPKPVGPLTQASRSALAFKAPSGPLSLQLSRIVMVGVGLGLILGDAFNGFWGITVIVEGSDLQRIIAGALYVLPAISAASAGAALLCGKERSKRPFGQHRALWAHPRPHGQRMELSRAQSAFDIIWRVSGTAALAVYVGVLVAGCIHPFRLPDPIAPTSGHSELLGYSMLAAPMASALLRARSRYAYIISLYPLAIGYSARLEGGLGLDVIAQATFLLTFNLALVASLTALYNRGERLGRALDELELRREAEAGAKARHIARRRVDSYVHDNILSVLTPITIGVGGGDFVRKAAQEALDSLESSRGGQDPTTAVQLFACIERAALQRDDSVEISLEVEKGSSRTPLAPEICEAFQGVVAEALNNSFRHARRSDNLPVSRTLELKAKGDSIEVFVRDNGDSCEPSALARPFASGHGISTSIVGRMRDIGGDASVFCDPSDQNKGVCVHALWKNPSPTELIGLGVDVENQALSSSLDTWSVRAIGVWALVGTVIMVTGQVSNFSSLLLPVLALLSQLTAAALLLAPVSRGVSPRWVLWLSIVIVGVSNLLALAPITVAGYPDYAAWSLGTGWLLCILILFRGGATLAWVGMGALGVSTCVWALVSGRGAVVALQLIVGQAVALFLWTLVAWWGQKLFKSTAETQVQIRNTEALRVSTQAMTALLEERLEKVARRARPVLERLASDEPLDSEARLAAKVLEGELRDEIRASALCDEQLVEAARDARRRGLEVVLLDDRGEVPLDDDLMNVVRSKGLEALRGATEGRVVIRLLPAGRKNIASIVAPGRTVTVGE